MRSTAGKQDKHADPRRLLTQLKEAASPKLPCPAEICQVRDYSAVFSAEGISPREERLDMGVYELSLTLGDMTL